MKKYLLLILLLTFITLPVYARSNPYKQYQTLGGSETINCTWAAWKNAKEKGGVELPGWGNADTWYNSAKKAGFSVGQEPKPNSIMVLRWSNYGHVVYVESVKNGIPYYWDTYDCYYETPEYHKCLEEGENELEQRECANLMDHGICYDRYDLKDLIGYIYLDSVPKTTTTKKKTTTKTTTKKTTTTITTTTNEDTGIIIDIDNDAFHFEEDTLEYSLETENDTIEIKGSSANKNLTLEGLGIKELNVGNNSFKIDVIKDKKVFKTYTINVLRTEKVSEVTTSSTTTTKPLKEEKENEDKTLGIILVIIGIVILITIMVILLKKRIKGK